jgi:competence protein ComGC
MINLKKIWIFVLTLLCLILLSTLFSKCENEKTQLANVNALNSQIKTYKLKNGQLAWSVESLGYTKEQLRKNIIDKDLKIKELTDKFSNVKSVTKYVTKTVIDTVEIKYNDSIPCVFEKVGAIFEKDYSLEYKSTQKGITIMELSIPDSVMVVTGQKRKWFLGKETTTLDMTHSNKFVQTEYVQHVEVVIPKKWYDTTLFKFGLGFILGKVILK